MEELTCIRLLGMGLCRQKDRRVNAQEIFCSLSYVKSVRRPSILDMELTVMSGYTQAKDHLNAMIAGKLSVRQLILWDTGEHVTAVDPNKASNILRP
mmetsp:Transcript_13598/g.20440  ORF Transcript_13598/g.20440 Transcript_13598/m.20440 type:complete len:97 (+) Transcript_13598:1135-1425(+)